MPDQTQAAAAISGPALPPPVQLQPTMRFPLLGAKDGAISWPEVMFNKAGDRIVVVDFYPPFWSWPSLRWHSPDLAVVCVLLALVWTAIRAKRNSLAPRDSRGVGRWLCRACAYDLTPPGTDPRVRASPGGIPVRCSECGASTARHPPRQVRARARRMLFPIITLLAVGAGAACVLESTLERATGFPEPERAWPSPRLSSLLSRVLLTLQRQFFLAACA